MKRYTVYWFYIILLCIVWMGYIFWRLKPKEVGFDEHSSFSEVPLTDLRISERIIKLNDVQPGEIVTAMYILYNIGDYPLVINYAKADCTCTSFEFSDSITQPGDSSRIYLVYDSSGKSGMNFVNAVIKVNTPISLYKIGLVINVKE